MGGIPLRRLPALPSARLPNLTVTNSKTTRPSRPFSSTRAAQMKTIKSYNFPRDLVPEYPYGDRRLYKQSNRGLYGNKRIRFGNSVQEKHNTKAQRFFRPNVHVKIMKSEALDVRIRLRLTLRVLKTIRREGGIDNYLLKTKPRRLEELGPCGWGLRWLLMLTQKVQQRFNEERVKLGLQPKEIKNQDEIINYVLDRATPGPLNARNRATLFKLRASVADAIVLPDGSQMSLDGGNLSDKADQT
ncbi:hypothetical protein CP533_5737 [Ophiocordyceps camponoti-saundersi (nom. inval.)]|nr:hypothetical protein CP533_5737 [Ophiocordyceps camponoti-saundersi (nom. inval.)]